MNLVSKKVVYRFLAINAVLLCICMLAFMADDVVISVWTASLQGIDALMSTPEQLRFVQNLQTEMGASHWLFYFVLVFCGVVLGALTEKLISRIESTRSTSL